MTGRFFNSDFEKALSSLEQQTGAMQQPPGRGSATESESSQSKQVNRAWLRLTLALLGLFAMLSWQTWRLGWRAPYSQAVDAAVISAANIEGTGMFNVMYAFSADGQLIIGQRQRVMGEEVGRYEVGRYENNDEVRTWHVTYRSPSSIKMYYDPDNPSDHGTWWQVWNPWFFLLIVLDVSLLVLAGRSFDRV